MIINRENDYFLISPILQKFRIRHFGQYFYHHSTINEENAVVEMKDKRQLKTPPKKKMKAKSSLPKKKPLRRKAPKKRVRKKKKAVKRKTSQKKEVKFQ